MSSPKQKRGAEIAAIIDAVSKYYGVSPERVYTSFAPKDRAIARSRVIVWYHLHQCGMGLNSIARLFGVRADNVQRRVRYGTSAMSSEESLLLATLPKLELTLDIRRVEV